jgi:hypothetical protein
LVFTRFLGAPYGLSLLESGQSPNGNFVRTADLKGWSASHDPD